MQEADHTDFVIPCGRCGKRIPRSQMESFKGIPLFCPQCVLELDESCSRTCKYCGDLFTASASNRVDPLCQECRTEYRLKEWRRVQNQIHRAEEIGAKATLTLRQWLITVEYFDDLCAYCQKRPFTQLDHFIPIGLPDGGTTLSNCVPACGLCNRRKAWINPHSIRPISQFHLDSGLTIEMLHRVGVYLRSLEQWSGLESWRS